MSGAIIPSSREWKHRTTGHAGTVSPSAMLTWVRMEHLVRHIVILPHNLILVFLCAGMVGTVLVCIAGL